MKSYALALLIALQLVDGSHAQQAGSAAPLGLEWGIGAEELKSKGVNLGNETDSNFGKAYVLTKLPQALADQDGAIGYFGHDNRLWRLIVIGKPNSNDPYGTITKARYDALLDILAEKYGKPGSFHRTGDSIYGKSEYFIYGIKEGRNSWFSNFKSNDLKVQLSIIADSSDTSQWRIIYENERLRASFDKSKRSKEKGAL